MASVVFVEIETAIRAVSWATAQVGQKSLQRLTIDFESETVDTQFLTGKTEILGVELGSIRDSFKLIRPRFNANNKAFFSVSGETASAVVLMPNINYQFEFEVSPDEATYSGSHDGYPSYNIAINGSSVYDFVQGHLGELIGDSDVKVMRQTVPCPKA
jgi:hypothetical protein